MTFRYYPRAGLAEVFVARDDYRATLVSAGPEGGPRWHFQPFGRDLVRCAVPVDERHVLCVAENDDATIAVLDVVERREVARRSDVFWKTISDFTVSRGGTVLLVFGGSRSDHALPRFLSLPALTDLTGYPAPGPIAPDSNDPIPLFGKDAVDCGDGTYVIALEGRGSEGVFATCVADLEGSFTLAVRRWEEEVRKTESVPQFLSPAGTYLLRRTSTAVLIRRTEPETRLERLGLKKPRYPEATGPDTVYGIGIEIWSTSPLRPLSRIIVHELTAGDAAYLAENQRSDVRLKSIDRFFAPGAMKADCRSALLDSWSNGAEWWSLPKVRLPDVQRYLTSIEWDQDERGFTLTLADRRRRRIGVDGSVGPLLDPLPLAYPHVMLAPDAKRDAAYAALEALTKAAVRVHGRSEEACVDAIRQIAARVRRSLKTLVFGHQLRLTFDVGDEEWDEPTFFGYVAQHCPGARDALRELLDAYTSKAPKIPLKLTGQLYYDDENGALTYAAAALASIDPDAFEHLQGWFDLRDPGHEVGATSYVLPEIARVGGWRTAAHIRFGLHERARQVLEGTGGVTLSELGILDGARAAVSAADFVACIDEAAGRLSTRFRYTRANADIALRDLILAELQAGISWDIEVGDRLAVADAA